MHTDAPTFFFLVVVSNKTKQISKSISTGKRKENSTFSKTISINNIRERAHSTHTFRLTWRIFPCLVVGINALVFWMLWMLNNEETRSFLWLFRLRIEFAFVCVCALRLTDGFNRAEPMTSLLLLQLNRKKGNKKKKQNFLLFCLIYLFCRHKHTTNLLLHIVYIL